MTRYLISFDDGAMTFPEEDLPAVAAAAGGQLLAALAGCACACSGASSKTPAASAAAHSDRSGTLMRRDLSSW